MSTVTRCCPASATTSSFPSDNARVNFLKQRFAGIINKAQLFLGGSTPIKNENEGLHKTTSNMLKKRAFEKTLNCEKQSITLLSKDANGLKRRRKNEEDSELERKKNRKIEIERMRAAARREIDEMRNDTGMGDPQEVMREFAKLIGYDTATGLTVPDTSSLIHSEKTISVQGFTLVDHCFKDELVEVEEGEITD